MLLVENIINFIFILASIFATAVIAWAGMLLLTSRGDEGQMKKAKEMIWKVVWGYVWILVAWLLVYTISNALLKDDFFLLGQP